MNKEIIVWTNGRAISRYQGQDKRNATYYKTKESGYFKAKAILIPLESDNKDK